MKLSKKAINDLKKIYLKEFGKTISDDEINTFGINLLNFFSLIYKPISKV